MLDTAGRIWARLQEFVTRVTELERKADNTEDDVKHLARELDIFKKEAAHDQRVNTRIQDQQGQTIADLQARVQKLEREKRGKAISAGIAKAELEKLRSDTKSSPKRRH